MPAAEESPRGKRLLSACGATVLIALAAQSHAFDGPAVERLMTDNECQGCDLSGADLSKAELSGAGLAAADLSNADLRQTLLLGAMLTGADLSGADLTGARLDDARLDDADLTGAKLAGARLGGADLGSAKGLTQAQLDGACADAGGAPYALRLPPGLTVKTCR